MPVFEGLGKALRWLREKQGRRQYELAASAKVTKAMLSAYETEKQRPSVETLERILDALGVDLATLGDALDLVNERVSERTDRPGGPSQAAPGSVGGIDVVRLLGVSSLPAEEERALGQMLDGFHRFLRYLHTAREAEVGDGGGQGGRMP